MRCARNHIEVGENMLRRYNPFKPTSPVSVGMFVGRIKEINRIDEILFQTKFENPTNLLILGERGIGKSSLSLVAALFASGGYKWGTDTFNFLTAQLSINDETTIADLARQLKNGIERELNKEEKALDTIKKLWDFVHTIRIGGSGLKKESLSLNESEIVDKTIYSIADTVKAITEQTALSSLGLREQKDGIVILIDEADNASKQLKIGAFLKNLLETLVKENCSKVLIIMAGLPRLRSILRESHESSLRLFEEQELNTLSPDEVKEVIGKGIKEIKEKSSIDVTVDEDALDHIVFFSEGYPHFVQQIGYSVLELDKDNHITKNNVIQAMFMEGGALDCIGDRYYKHLYFDLIKEDSYRRILHIMAEKEDNWISKKEIEKDFKGKGTTLTNGLKALRERNIILSKPGTKGVYRLQWKGFALWLKRTSERLQSAEKTPIPYGTESEELTYDSIKKLPSGEQGKK